MMEHNLYSIHIPFNDPDGLVERTCTCGEIISVTGHDARAKVELMRRLWAEHMGQPIDPMQGAMDFMAASDPRNGSG